ncbi:SUMF1/EgtB/PvdO family nonheme iron enzyme [Myxococcota bacterium]|nr:SUMF1/EgtB/PvdO family nonheme iron enzyme [Myxococcota bacterium]MBU1431939.1 SUMF1/EgtB/PvdO family nonheme iron enzyme [Myxococcota bacterium]MBU1897163.1 SUMF1/EgtB/PvdO family nonheme iron enzyme [Myxococcota bacterium]
MGRILAAWDLHLGRPVAIKILRRTNLRDLDRVRFLEEAQVTGQLQHPSIMPVYELGRLRGEMAFVMKRIEGRSLKEIIALRRDGGEDAEPYSVMRLLTIFQQLCTAVAFAHSKGVVHRDLKPSNVMVGDFGEVVLLDWGLCKIIGQATRSTRSTSARWQTVAGQIIGTPAYMAPEQAMGLIDQVDARTDVYGLGAILYQLLTLKPPFTGKSNREIVRRVLRETVQPPSQRVPEMEIPSELEAICMTCLQRDPDKRFRNATALMEALTTYLEGPRNSGPSKAQIKQLFDAGVAANLQRQELLEDLALERDTLQMAQLSLNEDANAAEHEEVWVAEARVDQIEIEIARVMASAVGQLSQLVSLAPHHVEGRRLLCELLLVQLEEAEQRREGGLMAYYKELLRAFDNGDLEKRLAGQGSLSVEVYPRDVQMRLSSYVEHQRRLIVGEGRDVGRAPIKLDPIKAGIYHLQIQAQGYVPLVTSFEVEPGKQTRLRFHLKQAPGYSGYALIPAGTFHFGAGKPGRGVEQAVPNFFIAEMPVTSGAYLEFLRAYHDPDEALALVPRAPDGRALWFINGAGIYEMPLGWDPQIPVVGISQRDAMAYCAWLNTTADATYRLPHEEEWEKAGRSGDGRNFPWGDHWDPSLAMTPESYHGHLPPPVGPREADVSPYGVYDLAGGVREWTLTPAPGRRSEIVVVRGGSYLTGGESGRPLWYRDILHRDRVAMDIGFRVIKTPRA